MWQLIKNFEWFVVLDRILSYYRDAPAIIEYLVFNISTKLIMGRIWDIVLTMTEVSFGYNNCCIISIYLIFIYLNLN